MLERNIGIQGVIFRKFACGKRDDAHRTVSKKADPAPVIQGFLLVENNLVVSFKPLGAKRQDGRCCSFHEEPKLAFVFMDS